MNNLEALIIVRGAARVSAQMRTRQGIAAGKVVDRKIQSLLRKKAWREGNGSTPVHMGNDDFRYTIPDDPITAALKGLMARIEAYQGQRFYDQVKPEWEAAKAALTGLENK